RQTSRSASRPLRLRSGVSPDPVNGKLGRSHRDVKRNRRIVFAIRRAAPSSTNPREKQVTARENQPALSLASDGYPPLAFGSLLGETPQRSTGRQLSVGPGTTFGWDRKVRPDRRLRPTARKDQGSSETGVQRPEGRTGHFGGRSHPGVRASAREPVWEREPREGRDFGRGSLGVSHFLPPAGRKLQPCHSPAVGSRSMTVEITARLETLSPSRAGDFKTCPRLYAFRTVERIPEPTTVHQARGTTAHLALQRLFDLPAPERTPRRLSELFRQAWTELRGLEEYEELFPTVEAERAWGLESMGLLLNYFLLEDPARLAPLGREEELKEDLGGIVIHGILDRIDRGEDGRLVITDYKTGKAPPEGYAFGAFFALKIYALL